MPVLKPGAGRVFPGRHRGGQFQDRLPDIHSPVIVYEKAVFHRQAAVMAWKGTIERAEG
jgi:hypothetical protein